MVHGINTLQNTGSDVRLTPEFWEALVHPGQKLKPGARVVFEGTHTIYGEILERRLCRRIVRLWTDDGSTLDDAIDASDMPLPPSKRDDGPDDRDRYGPSSPGRAPFRPTAGLPSPKLHRRGARGTSRSPHHPARRLRRFQPIRVDRVEIIASNRRHYQIGAPAADAINRARGGRRAAVGTTTTRTLEAVARPRTDHGGQGDTDLFLYPGAEFLIVGGL
jgi:S-adenosylmethionine:tRNA ribosyltransferase-isomerase